MSEFYGTQKIRGSVYVNNIGGYPGSVSSPLTLQSIVNKQLFKITNGNIAQYYTSGVLELQELRYYSGVQIEQGTYSSLVVNLPVAPSMFEGAEFTVLNLGANKDSLTIGSSSGTLGSGKMVITWSTAHEAIAITRPILGFLKAIRFKSVAIGTSWGWTVISMTPSTSDLVSGDV